MNRAGMIRTAIRIGRTLEYERYIHLQDRLRIRKNELLLFCEHNRIITAGVSFEKKNLLMDVESLENDGITFYRTQRGGDLTAHEPGQCVIYPHVDLHKRKIQLSHFFSTILKITSQNLKKVWDIETVIGKKFPGLYLPAGEKIASIGITFKSFFTGHGIAVNISNDLSTFRHIVPCGLEDVSMTSVGLLGRDVKLVCDFVEAWKEDFQVYLREPPPSHMHSSDS